MKRSEELYLKWLEKAKDDMKYAKGNFGLKFYSQTCFLCQQSAEKALKAFLFYKDQKLIKTHNLERLLEKLIFFKNEFLKLRENCQVLNDYYTDTRYPDIWDYDRFDNKKLAFQALKLAEEILEFVEKEIKTG